MKIKAEPVAYSSILGAGALLLDAQGQAIAQIALLGVGGDREKQEALRDYLVKTINAGQIERQVTHTKRGSIYDVIADRALFQVSDAVAGIRHVRDGDPVTVYRNETGTYVRFPDEMIFPRFELI